MATEIKPGFLLVVCEDCRHRYAIKAVYLGRKFCCVKCGSVSQMREAEERKESVETKELPGEKKASTGNLEIKVRNAEKVLANRIMAQALYERQKVKQALEKGEDAYQVSKFKEFYVPVGILVVGLLIHIGWCPWWLRTINPTIVWWQYLLIVMGLQVLVYFPLGVGAVAMTARIYGVGFGTIKEVLFKLAVLTFGVGAVADGIHCGIAMGMSGGMMVPVFSFMPYVVMVGLPLALFFGLSFGETMLTVGLIYVPRFLTFVVLGLVIPDIYR